MLDETVIKTQRFKLGDVDIPVRRGGDGVPLIFLDGGEAMHRSGEFLESLAGRWQVHAPGLPGGADSEFSDQIRDVGDLALLYLDLIDALDSDKVILAGASFGGWVAAEMAVRCPGRFAALVLIDAVGIKNGDRRTRDITDIHSLLPDSRKETLFHTEAHRNFAYSDYSAEDLDPVVRDLHCARAAISRRSLLEGLGDPPLDAPRTDVAHATA